MGRFNAGLLLVLYFFSITPLKELTKIPMLASHYSLHNIAGNRTGFLEFIKAHYLDNTSHSHSQDDEQHDQLPFKSYADAGLLNVYVTTCLQIIVKIKTWNNWQESENNLWHLVHFIPLPFITSIFHPPQ